MGFTGRIQSTEVFPIVTFDGASVLAIVSILWLLPASQFFFVLQAVMVEGAGPFKGLGRSSRLGRARAQETWT